MTFCIIKSKSAKCEGFHEIPSWRLLNGSSIWRRESAKTLYKKSVTNKNIPNLTFTENESLKIYFCSKRPVLVFISKLYPQYYFLKCDFGSRKFVTIYEEFENFDQ